MATKKAAESTLYHLSPKGFWKKLRDTVVVNPEISSGLPVAGVNRYPQPGSRPEKYATPATKASDLAQNPYWKRDVRRAYPQLSVITQSDLSSFLLQRPEDQTISAPSSDIAADNQAVPAAPKKPIDLTAAISEVASGRKLYSESNLPPAIPTPFKRWRATLAEDAPHDPNAYFPMLLYNTAAIIQRPSVLNKYQQRLHMSSSAPPSAAAGSSAEVQAAAFADDPRIYFSKDTNTWRLEEDDGTELEYDATNGAWIPLVDENLMKSQQAAYSVAGVDEEMPAAPVLARANKKRKAPADYTSATPVSEAGPSIKRGRNDKSNTNKPAGERKSKNTAVYVTGLPLDAEADELVERFSKCGVIEEDDQGEPKVKMYARDDGSFSGDALVVYFKEDSVSLALNILDDAELRLGDPSTTMRVQKAEFGRNTGAQSNVSEDAKPRKTIDKKKASKRIGKMQKKLLEWDDEDGFGPMIAPEDSVNAINKNSRVVVLKHMFTLKELEEDTALMLDLKEDVREECASLGDVTNVVLYDKEIDGVMTVKFRDPISAQACVLKMNGRFFAGRQIDAALYSGKQRFRRSGTGEETEGEGDEAEKKRLDDFAQWLLTEGD